MSQVMLTRKPARLGKILSILDFIATYLDEPACQRVLWNAGTHHVFGTCGTLQREGSMARNSHPPAWHAVHTGIAHTEVSVNGRLGAKASAGSRHQRPKITAAAFQVRPPFAVRMRLPPSYLGVPAHWLTRDVPLHSWDHP